LSKSGKCLSKVTVEHDEGMVFSLHFGDLPTIVVFVAGNDHRRKINLLMEVFSTPRRQNAYNHINNDYRLNNGKLLMD